MVPEHELDHLRKMQGHFLGAGAREGVFCGFWELVDFLRKEGREEGGVKCQTEPRSGPAQDLPSHVSPRGTRKGEAGAGFPKAPAAGGCFLLVWR